jgi:hypothetical protein
MIKFLVITRTRFKNTQYYKLYNELEEIW